MLISRSNGGSGRSEPATGQSPGFHPSLEALFGETVGVPLKEPEEFRKLHETGEDISWA